MSRGSAAALLTAIHFGAGIAGIIVTVPGSIIAGGTEPGRVPFWKRSGSG